MPCDASWIAAARSSAVKGTDVQAERRATSRRTPTIPRPLASTSNIIGDNAVALTPGWLRSEHMLEAYGVTESTWRDATKRAPHFAISESPAARRIRWDVLRLP